MKVNHLRHLFDYMPSDAILIIDESHVTVPQIGGMYRGDRSRKETLVEYGFRLLLHWITVHYALKSLSV